MSSINKVCSGKEITPESVDKEQPDIVIIATGSKPSELSFPGADQKNIIRVWDALQDRVSIGVNFEQVDSVVPSTGNRANNQLYNSLKGKVKELYADGDCVAPCKAVDAIY